MSVYLEVHAGASEHDYSTNDDESDTSPPFETFSDFHETLTLNLSHIESRSAGAGSAFGSGAATASPGGVHVAANVSGAGSASPTTESGGSAQTDVQAAMGDSFVLLAPGLPIGAPLTLTASWSTSGNVFASFAANDGSSNANAYSTWSANFALIPIGGEGFHATRSAGCQHDSVAQACWGDDFGAAPAVVTVANGALVSVSISARARAWGSSYQAGGEGSASMNAFADLGNTVAWGGITSVQEEGGDPVSEYSASSADTGYDYRFAYAPEPQALELCAAAGAALFAVARSRRRTLRP